MKSKVYFTPVSERDPVSLIAEKLQKLLAESRVLDFLKSPDRVAVKIHFGEEGNTGFVRPEYARVVCDAISDKGAKPFLADTNTLYKGKRTNSREHLALAAEHGFTQESVAAEIVIPDDFLKENAIDVPIHQKFVQTAKLARFLVEADAIIGISHFKGHLLTGFGGALKNLGMGCASRAGKLVQHSGISPIVYARKCTACGECVKVCPASAISIRKRAVILGKSAVIDSSKCIGCATCIAVCPFSAIDVQWETGRTMPEKMVEYAWAVMQGKKERAAFFNFAIKITKECDCMAKDDPRVAPDIGILACLDPVSIDQASFDLVRQVCGRDIFRELHPKRDSSRQLRHAHELGLGNLDYELVTL
ncbi:MAG: hypothetical protein AMJ95_08615 [Omnitrophica WOR_2 bacterium SM23_72]|nr:MAG: hypothetical protein AMJ95_08615 [Omnitrophica WOR_2 bacterium SM23_72]